uniref:Uncharacterized protein n=1 Tax=Anguilla anguilla TaxID=7936 RepID=A0A0E9SPE9_ANGAN
MNFFLTVNFILHFVWVISEVISVLKCRDNVKHTPEK